MPGSTSLGCTRYGSRRSVLVAQPVDLDPRHLLAAFVVAGELLDLGAVGPHDLVAAHARRDRGKVRDRRARRAGVAVEAVHAQLPGVDLVAVVDRLDGTVR